MIKLEIFNDETGTEEVGHYGVYLYLPVDGRRVEHHVRVENFDRTLGWEELVKRAVQALSEVA